MDETKCLKFTLKPKLSQPQMTHQLAVLTLKNTFPGTSEFFSEDMGCSLISLLKSPVLGGSGIQPGDSGLLKVAVADLDLRVFIPPCLLMVTFLPAPNSSFAHIFSQALTPTY
jgi:hypothetical protein